MHLQSDRFPPLGFFSRYLNLSAEDLNLSLMFKQQSLITVLIGVKALGLWPVLIVFPNKDLNV